MACTCEKIWMNRFLRCSSVRGIMIGDVFCFVFYDIFAQSGSLYRKTRNTEGERG